MLDLEDDDDEEAPAAAPAPAVPKKPSRAALADYASSQQVLRNI